MQHPGGGGRLQVVTAKEPGARPENSTHHGLKQTLNDISNTQRKMQRKMIEADKNLRGLFRDMFEKHGGPEARFTVELEQPLKSLLLQIKRDILRTVKEERVILREFSISEGLPAHEIPEVLTRGVDVDSPSFRAKLQNPKFQSSAASVRNASLKTQAHLKKTLHDLGEAQAEVDTLRLTVASQEKELRSLQGKLRDVERSAAQRSADEGRDYNTLLEKHEKALANFKSTHAKMSSTVAQYKEHIESLNKQKKERVQTITGLRATKTKQKELLTQQQKMIQDLSDQVKTQDRDAARLRKQITSLQHKLKVQEGKHNEQQAAAKLANTTALEKARAAHEEELRQAVLAKEELLADNFAAHSRALNQKYEVAQHAATSAKAASNQLEQQLQDLSSRLAQESTQAQRSAKELTELQDQKAENNRKQQKVLVKLQSVEHELRASQDEGLKLRYEFENLRHFEASLLQRQAAGESAVSSAQRDAEASIALHRKALTRFEEELRAAETSSKRREEALSTAFEQRLAASNREARLHTNTLEQQLEAARAQLAEAERSCHVRTSAAKKHAEEEISAARQEMRAAEVARDEEGRAAAQLRAALQHAQEEAAAAENSLTTEVQAVTSLHELVEKLKHECASAQEELQSVKQESRSLRVSEGQEASAWAAERASLNQRIAAVQSARDKVVAEVADQQEGLRYAESVAAAAQVEAQQLKTELQNLQSSYGKTEAEAEAAQVLAKELAQARSALEQCGRDAELAQNQRTLLERRIADAEAKQHEAEALAENHRRAVDVLKAAQTEDINARVTQAEAEVTRLENERRAAEQRATELRQEIALITDQLTAAEATHNESAALVEKTQQEKDEALKQAHAQLRRIYSAHREQDCRTLRALKDGLTGLVQTLHRATLKTGVESKERTTAADESIELASEVISDAEELLIELAATGAVTMSASPRRHTLYDADSSSGSQDDDDESSTGHVSSESDDDEDYGNKKTQRGTAAPSHEMETSEAVSSCVHRASICLGKVAEAFRDFVDAGAARDVAARADAAGKYAQLLKLRNSAHSCRGELSDLKAKLKMDVTSCRVQAMQALQTLHRRHHIAATTLRGHVKDAVADRDAAEESLKTFHEKHTATLSTMHNLRVELQHASSAVEVHEATGEARERALRRECEDAERALSYQRQRHEEDLADRLRSFESQIRVAQQTVLERVRNEESLAERRFVEREAELEKEWKATAAAEKKKIEEDAHAEALAMKQLEMENLKLRETTAAEVQHARQTADAEAKQALQVARNNYIRALAQNQEDSDEQLEAKERAMQLLETELHDEKSHYSAEVLKCRGLTSMQSLLETEMSLQGEQAGAAARKIKELQSEHLALNSAVNERQQQVKEYIAAANNLRNETAELESKLGEANQSQSALTGELRDAVQAIADVRARLEAEVAASQKALKEAEASASASISTQEQLQQQLAEQNSELLHQAQELRHELVNAESQRLRAVQENERFRMHSASGLTSNAGGFHTLGASSRENVTAVGLVVGPSHPTTSSPSIVAVAREDLAAARAQVDSLRSHAAELEQKHAHDMQEAQRRIQVEQKRSQSFEEAANELARARDAAEQQLRRLERECSALTADLAQADLSRAAAASGDLASGAAERAALRQELQVSQKALREAEENVNSLESTLRKVKRNARKRIDELSQQLSSLSAQVKQLQGGNAEQRDEGPAGNRDALASAFFKDAMEQLSKSHQNQLEFAKATHAAALQQAAADHANQMSELESRSERLLAAEKTSAARRIDAAAKSKATAMAEVAAATEKLEKELEECQSLRLAHANLRGRNRALTTRVAKLEEEFEAARSELQSAQDAADRALDEARAAARKEAAAVRRASSAEKAAEAARSNLADALRHSHESRPTPATSPVSTKRAPDAAGAVGLAASRQQRATVSPPGYYSGSVPAAVKERNGGNGTPSYSQPKDNTGMHGQMRQRQTPFTGPAGASHRDSQSLPVGQDPPRGGSVVGEGAVRASPDTNGAIAQLNDRLGLGLSVDDLSSIYRYSPRPHSGQEGGSNKIERLGGASAFDSSRRASKTAGVESGNDDEAPVHTRSKPSAVSRHQPVRPRRSSGRYMVDSDDEDSDSNADEESHAEYHHAQAISASTLNHQHTKGQRASSRSQKNSGGGALEDEIESLRDMIESFMVETEK